MADPTTLTELFTDVGRGGAKECFATVSSSDQRLTGSVTCSEFLDGALRTATALRERGLERGDRVALVAEVSVPWVQAFAGTVLAGGIAVPTNHAFTEGELARVLDVTRPAFALSDPSRDGVIRAAGASLEDRGPVVLDVEQLGAGAPDESSLVRVAPDDPAVILHTSGTTGRPKGVVKTHGEYACFAAWWADVVMSPDDRAVSFLPFYHQAGLTVTFLGALAKGIPTFFADRYRPETFWDTIDAHDLSWLVMMQPMPRQLLDLPPSDDDRSHALRWAFGTAGGAENWIRFQDRFGVRFHSSYGSTETTIVYVTGTRSDGPVTEDRIRGPHGGSLCGRARPDWSEVRLSPLDGAEPSDDFGFIEVSGPAVFSRYFDDDARTAEAFAPDGWFRTGDYGYLTPSGDLYLVDRVSNMIRRSGENIAPREVEDVLLLHEAVEECAVVGVDDEIRGQEVAAFVHPAPGTAPDADALFDHCRSHLASFKVPRYLEFVSSFPRTRTHKIQTSELKLTAATVDRFADRRPA